MRSMSTESIPDTKEEASTRPPASSTGTFVAAGGQHEDWAE
jgi:hypothetical protein